MAKSRGKKKKGKDRKPKKAGRFHVEMTNRIRLFLIGCFIVGFVAMTLIFFH